MLNARLTLFLTLLVSCATSANQLTGPAPTTSGPAVARLRATSESGGGQCSIWKIDGGMAVTAGHCCDPDSTYTATGDNAVPGAMFTVLFDDDIHDVCVMRGEMRGKPIKLAFRDPRVGERIWTAGFPHGKYLISDGFWAGRDDDNEGICSSVVGGGASGSPVLNLSGESVGVVIKRFMDMDNVTFVAPVEWVRTAVARARLQL